MGRMTPEDKRLQSRSFDTTDEGKILSASGEVLQDLGFTLVESEMDLGLIVGSQDRDSIKAGHVLLTAILAGLNDTPPTHSEKIQVSVVTSPAEEDAKRTSVRVTFQRIVWDDYGRLSELEKLHISRLYRGFFEKLSRAVSLKAHGGEEESFRSRVLVARKKQVKRHSIRSRLFDTTDKVRTLRAVIATLQDLDFVINKADEFLGSVSAIRPDHHAVRMKVDVRSHGETQIRVTANALYNLKTIEDPGTYQQFFAALEKSMSLTAHNVEEDIRSGDN
jgi:hypothetical protein